jgi:hypothetical protein
VLVVVPCGKQKIWQREPDRGPVAARDAYTSEQIRRNRRYAERFGDAWVILSAKYGFVAPDFPIPGPYDVTFKRRATMPVEIPALRDQVRAMGLDRVHVVVGLGGKDYRARIDAAFADAPVRLVFPFAGLPQGRLLRATKVAVKAGDLGFAAVFPDA